MDRKYAFAAMPLLAAVFAAPFSSKAADAPDKPVLVQMQAALDIDRDGRVAAVELIDDRKLPDVIRQRAQQTALSLKFQPPVKAGQPVSGRTYAGIQVCLAPGADGIDYTLAVTGNGPASSFRPPRKPRSIAMPMGKLLDQGVTHLKGKMVYVVSPEGMPTFERATLDDPELQRQYGKLWQKDQRELLKSFRFRPELIDGTPTSTRLETVVEHRWGDSLEDLKADEAARHAKSDACRALRNDDGRQLASDSPFKRIDS